MRHIFTDSALWAGLVIELPCPPVRLSACPHVRLSAYPHVTKVVIVDNDQFIRFFVFLYQIMWPNMVLRILNLEGHKNCTISSKITKILTMFLEMINQGIFFIWNQFIVDIGGFHRGRFVAVGFSDRSLLFQLILQINSKK